MLESGKIPDNLVNRDSRLSKTGRNASGCQYVRQELKDKVNAIINNNNVSCS
jgi:hypothetical protein